MGISFRRRGAAETLKRVEHLPPTPISPEAERALLAWGISKESLMDLRELTASFRYDLCAEKLERIAKIGCVFTHNQAENSVWLPNFFDVQGRFEGQCGDIARQFIMQIYFSGLIHKLREESGQDIRVKFSWGQSKTHFVKSSDTHAWCQLENEDQPFQPEIIVDGAFQTISTLNKSGYKRLVTLDCEDGFGAVPVDIKLTVGTGTLFREGFAIQTAGSDVILGASSDKKFVYGLGFIRLEDEDVAQPVLLRINSYGLANRFMINPEDGELLSRDKLLFGLPSAEQKEVVNLLLVAAKIEHSSALAQHKDILGQKHTFTW